MFFISKFTSNENIFVIFCLKIKSTNLEKNLKKKHDYKKILKNS